MFIFDMPYYNRPCAGLRSKKNNLETGQTLWRASLDHISLTQITVPPMSCTMVDSPKNMVHWTYVGLVLGQRHKRWPKPILVLSSSLVLHTYHLIYQQHHFANDGWMLDRLRMSPGNIGPAVGEGWCWGDGVFKKLCWFWENAVDAGTNLK